MSNPATDPSLIAGVVAAYAIVVVVLYVWVGLALSRVFQKSGVEGWKAWVPVLNTIVLLQLGGFSGWLVLLALVVGPGTLALWVIQIVACHRINVSFGHGAGMTVLAALLFPVWASVLGFGSSRWVGRESSAPVGPLRSGMPSPERAGFASPAAATPGGAPARPPVPPLPGYGAPRPGAPAPGVAAPGAPAPGAAAPGAVPAYGAPAGSAEWLPQSAPRRPEAAPAAPGFASPAPAPQPAPQPAPGPAYGRTSSPSAAPASATDAPPPLWAAQAQAPATAPAPAGRPVPSGRAAASPSGIPSGPAGTGDPAGPDHADDAEAVRVPGPTRARRSAPPADAFVDDEDDASVEPPLWTLPQEITDAVTGAVAGAPGPIAAVPPRDDPPAEPVSARPPVTRVPPDVASPSRAEPAEREPWAPALSPTPDADAFPETSAAVSAIAGAPAAGSPRSALASVSALHTRPHVPEDEESLDETVVARRKRTPWTLVPASGRSIAITSSVVIVGRRPAADPDRLDAQLVALDDDTRTVSKTHARLELRDDRWWIVDLHSTNGVVLKDADGDESEAAPGVEAPAGEHFLLGDAEVRLERSAG